MRDRIYNDNGCGLTWCSSWCGNACGDGDRNDGDMDPPKYSDSIEFDSDSRNKKHKQKNKKRRKKRN